MILHKFLEHRFVRNVPRELEPGVLYVSMDYATAVHSCCCGCGERVVTPFTQTGWRMTFDGESISLHPSVGNWNQDCRTHYVIDRNRVIQCGLLSNARIEAEQQRGKRVKDRCHDEALGQAVPHAEYARTVDSRAKARSLLAWLRDRFLQNK